MSDNNKLKEDRFEEVGDIIQKEISRLIDSIPVIEFGNKTVREWIINNWELISQYDRNTREKITDELMRSLRDNCGIDLYLNEE